MPDRNAELSVGDLMEALCHPQRRYLLLELLERTPRDGPPPTIDVSDPYPGSNGRPPSLEHAHLPRLAEYGLVDWNETHHEVTAGPNFGQVEPLLRLLKEGVIEWDEVGSEVRKGRNFGEFESVIDLVSSR